MASSLTVPGTSSKSHRVGDLTQTRSKVPVSGYITPFLLAPLPPEVSSWIVCDGDIDPEWIESLNSVLDDNRLLTMPSGERIQFGPNVNFLFETHDLSCASPATISRMGMIFLRSVVCPLGHLFASNRIFFPPPRVKTSCICTVQ